MSTIAIKIRCDHDTCTATVDSLDLQHVEGWLHNTVPVWARIVMALDYCPDHAAEHMSPNGLTLLADLAPKGGA